MKKYLVIFLIVLILTLIVDLLFNILKVRPYNNNYGWLNAHDTYKNFIDEIEVNEFGTRDTFKKDPLKKNIILLGDSQVELAQEKNKLPARILEKYLDKFNVYSFGSWGWGTDQQLLILQKSIERIKPKYVILFFTSNDLTNNYHNIGFLGEKPTYELDKNLNLKEPEFQNLKKYLNYSWIYRVLYRIYKKYDNRHLANFLEDKKINQQPNCSNKNYIELNNLIDIQRDYIFFENKLKESRKYYPHLPVNQSDKDKRFYKFWDKRNNYEKITDRKFDFFRNFRTDLEQKKIELTNRLLIEIQKISYKYNAKFILLNTHINNYIFETDDDFMVCINNKEIIYSNKNYFKLFDDTFKNIDILVEYSFPRGFQWYEPKDGHLNYKTNKIVFKKVSDKILELEEKE